MVSSRVSARTPCGVGHILHPILKWLRCQFPHRPNTRCCRLRRQTKPLVPSIFHDSSSSPSRGHGSVFVQRHISLFRRHQTAADEIYPPSAGRSHQQKRLQEFSDLNLSHHLKNWSIQWSLRLSKHEAGARAESQTSWLLLWKDHQWAVWLPSFGLPPQDAQAKTQNFFL